MFYIAARLVRAICDREKRLHRRLLLLPQAKLDVFRQKRFKVSVMITTYNSYVANAVLQFGKKIWDIMPLTQLTGHDRVLYVAKDNQFSGLYFVIIAVNLSRILGVWLGTWSLFLEETFSSRCAGQR